MGATLFETPLTSPKQVKVNVEGKIVNFEGYCKLISISFTDIIAWIKERDSDEAHQATLINEITKLDNNM